MKTLKVPKEFLDFTIINYPSDINKNFEAYFYNYFSKNNLIMNIFIYLFNGQTI